jgi:serine protease DegS
VKISSFLKYFFRSFSYGIFIAVALLILLPSLRDESSIIAELFQPKTDYKAPLSYAKAVSIAGPAVVNIYSNDIQKPLGLGQPNKNTTRLGSGVIMASDGYILTNFHVVKNADLIEVLLQSGQVLPAELIGFDVYTDLAVLKVNENNLPVIPQKKNMKPLVGDVVLAIGNPLNLGQTVTQGIVSGTGRNGLSTTSYLEFLQMDAAINEGNSGGALVNTNGELVAINSRKFAQSTPNISIQGIFFAVPFQLANKVMQKIIEHGRVVRGWLGISARSYLSNIKGFVVDEVTLDSPAYNAGIQVNDVIFNINDTPVISVTQSLDIIAETPPNTTIIISIYRGKETLHLPVKIIEYKH